VLNYLEKFEPVIRNHLGSVSGKPSSLSYFAPDTQNELAHLLEAAVSQASISPIQKAEYYSVIFNMT
jgi:hypothetical protein